MPARVEGGSTAAATWRAPPVNGNAADLADFLARDDDDDTLDELGAGDTGDAAGGAEVAAFRRADDG